MIIPSGKEAERVRTKFDLKADLSINVKALYEKKHERKVQSRAN